MGKHSKNHCKHYVVKPDCSRCCPGPAVQARVVAPSRINVYPYDVPPTPPYAIDTGFTTDPIVGPPPFVRSREGFPRTQPYYERFYDSNMPYPYGHRGPMRVYDECANAGVVSGAMGPMGPENPNAPVFKTYDERNREIGGI